MSALAKLVEQKGLGAICGIAVVPATGFTPVSGNLCVFQSVLIHGPNKELYPVHIPLDRTSTLNNPQRQYLIRMNLTNL